LSWPSARPVSADPPKPAAPDRTPFTVSYGWPLLLGLSLTALGWASLWAFTGPATLARVPGHPLFLLVLACVLAFVITFPSLATLALAQRLTIREGTLTVWRPGRRTLRVEIADLLRVVRYLSDRTVPSLKLVISGGHVIAVSAHARNFQRLSDLLDQSLPRDKIVGTWQPTPKR
jgi:hypothetical protein